MIWGILIFYIVGGLVWGFVTAMNWDVSRIYETEKGERARYARMVLLTPVWPFALAMLLVVTIGKVRADAEGTDE